MTVSDRVEVFRCERCERRAEQAEGSPAPECGEYTPGTRQRFPDGSWIMLGEGYTPHGKMQWVKTLDANPLRHMRDDDRKAARLEAERPERDAQYDRALNGNVDEPAGVTNAKR